MRNLWIASPFHYGRFLTSHTSPGNIILLWWAGLSWHFQEIITSCQRYSVSQALLGLLFVNRGLMGSVILGVCLALVTMKWLSLRLSSQCNENKGHQHCYSGFQQKKPLNLFMELFSRVTWQSALEGSMSAGQGFRSAFRSTGAENSAAL